jgi:hypothetical protein
MRTGGLYIPKVLVQAEAMPSTWCCYLLTFTTTAGKQRSYYGTTEVYQGQTPADACEKRLRYHRTRPKKWMRHALATSLAIEHLDTFCEQNALAQEALYTARALAKATAVRGACWSGPYMSDKWRGATAALRRATAGLSGQVARQAVLAYGRTLPETDPLRQHLDGHPFSGAPEPRVALPQHRPTGRSGTAGNTMRKRFRRTMVNNTDARKRLYQMQYGPDPQERRRQEYRRAARCMKALKATKYK